VAETWDGDLNDIYGMHVKAEHLFAALDGATAGPVAEGGVGGGTGMICYEFKGGIGTSSRVLAAKAGGYTVGVLVQSNFGGRAQLRVAGVPVGQEMANESLQLRPKATADARRENREPAKQDEPLVSMEQLSGISDFGLTPKGLVVYFDFPHAIAYFDKNFVPYSVIKEYLKPNGPAAKFQNN
jgi:hypothetical protein